jgi:L-ascorbate metabolism protein UlaG (beta-lactamase superfamily)
VEVGTRRADRVRFAIRRAESSMYQLPSGPAIDSLMPRETPFHGLIPPFPIRVDQFGASSGLTTVPALHLLSHTHSDHILGLSAKSFASTIICSPDAKQMLLRHEMHSERFLRDVDLRDEARLSRTFGHLKVSPCLKDGRLDFSVGRDFLVCYFCTWAQDFLMDT